MNSVYSPSPLSGEQEMKILSFSSWLDLSGPALLQEPTQSHRNKTKDAPHTLNRLPWWLSGKEPVCQCWSTRFNLWVGKSPWRRKWQPTPVFLPGEFHGQKSLVCYSPWGRKEPDATERLTLSLQPTPRVPHTVPLPRPSISEFSSLC